jgi:septum site-determining protein MinD
LNPTVPAISDGLKVQEYALSYGSDIAGTIFNRVRGDIDDVTEKADRYFEGPTLSTVPESDAVQAARSDGEPLLAHAPDSPAAAAFRTAAEALSLNDGDSDAVAERFRTAVIPDPP